MKGIPSVFWHSALSLSLAVVLASCSVDPLRMYEQNGEFQSQIVMTSLHAHKVLRKQGVGEHLHVYIEGDGVPWSTRYTIAGDPTPPSLIMPELMRRDPAPSVFLGRPCYFGLEDRQCSSNEWTFGRYSQLVVDSLSEVLDALAVKGQKIVIIGHSGGGTLAWLLAHGRDDVAAIVTLGSNLDTAAWAEYHRYSPLSRSVNPADLPPLGAQVKQWHYLGEVDKVVPPALVEPFIARQINAGKTILPGADHRCCWQENWPNLLVKALSNKPEQTLGVDG